MHFGLFKAIFCNILSAKLLPRQPCNLWHIKALDKLFFGQKKTPAAGRLHSLDYSPNSQTPHNLLCPPRLPRKNLL